MSFIWVPNRPPYSCVQSVKGLFIEMLRDQYSICNSIEKCYSLSRKLSHPKSTLIECQREVLLWERYTCIISLHPCLAKTWRSRTKKNWFQIAFWRKCERGIKNVPGEQKYLDKFEFDREEFETTGLDFDYEVFVKIKLKQVNTKFTTRKTFEKWQLPIFACN